MEKKLAIRGHATRGKEIIEILKMLGGRNSHERTGYNDETIYYIDDRNNINCDWTLWNNNRYTIFTLEEFLKKYPHKVGDKVVDGYGDTLTIKSMSWSEDCKTMMYDFEETGDVLAAEDFDLLKWNVISTNQETNMEESKDCPKAPILSNRYDYAEGKCGYVIPVGYEFDCIREGFQTEIILKPKKPKYPDNYEECSKYLGLQHCGLTIDLPFNYSPLFISLAQLYICRNAYWKLAGEEMGLGKPWEPDWKSDSKKKYCLCCNGGNINKYTWCLYNAILAFPTEEMRDVFYENFKKLIEGCKELL